MKLIIGGCAQGKLGYALERYGLGEDAVADGYLPGKTGERVIINHFHRWVKSCLKAGESPEEMIRAFVTEYPDCIIISDEVGNGIVPVDAFEREYRERLGRILIEIAKEAEEVVRVICGLGQKIK